MAGRPGTPETLRRPPANRSRACAEEQAAGRQELQPGAHGVSTRRVHGRQPVGRGEVRARRIDAAPNLPGDAHGDLDILGHGLSDSDPRGPRGSPLTPQRVGQRIHGTPRTDGPVPRARSSPR